MTHNSLWIVCKTGSDPVSSDSIAAIRRISPDEPAAIRLLEKSDELMASLYPASSNHLESIAALQKLNVAFFGAYVGDDLAGCGGVKTRDDDGVYGEIKRVFVEHRHRGRGISKAIVNHLEYYLETAGIRIVRLETGVRQPEARSLYNGLGYIERGPYGGYQPDPLSIFMEKQLDL